MAQGERSGWLAAGLSPRRVLVVAAIFIIAYFGVAIVGNALNRYELTRHQASIKHEIAGLEIQQRRLDALRAYMQTDEFIERAAREEGLIRPGDTAVVVAAPTPIPAADAAPPGPWWERYFGAGDR